MSDAINSVKKYNSFHLTIKTTRKYKGLRWLCSAILLCDIYFVALNSRFFFNRWYFHWFECIFFANRKHSLTSVTAKTPCTHEKHTQNVEDKYLGTRKLHKMTFSIMKHDLMYCNLEHIHLLLFVDGMMNRVETSIILQDPL